MIFSWISIKVMSMVTLWTCITATIPKILGSPSNEPLWKLLHFSIKIARNLPMNAKVRKESVLIKPQNLRFQAI